MNAPWKLVKEGSSEEQLDAVLYHLAESLTHHCHFDFTGFTESGARDFRSVELEDGI